MALVYIHRRLDIKDDYENVFYVGIGKNEKRPYSRNYRNSYWKRLSSKYDYKVEITHNNILWEEACSIEKYLIGFYGRKDLKLGNLCNQTDGGTGGFGQFKNSDTLIKLSNSLKEYYKSLDEKRKKEINNSIKIGLNKPESKVRLSNAQKLINTNKNVQAKRKISLKKFYENDEMKQRITLMNREMSSRPEVKNKISIATKSRWEKIEYKNNFSSKIKLTLSTKESKELKKKAAIESLNRPEIRKKLSDLQKIIQNKPEVKEKLKLIRSKRFYENDYSVDQYTEYGIFIKSWQKRKDAENEIGANVWEIRKAIKYKKKYKGFIWTNSGESPCEKLIKVNKNNTNENSTSNIRTLTARPY